MKNQISAFALAASLCTPALLYAQQTQMSPPVANRQPHETSIHGYTLTDDYFWLRQKTNPAVRSYLEAEHQVHGSGDEADRGPSEDSIQ